ncbi:MAG: DUF971 domain-containing protein [Verrucomicrobiales bacterium]
MVRPAEIQLIGTEVAIRWSDGQEDFYPSEKLRAFSPSAETQGERDLFGNLIGGSPGREFPGVEVLGWDTVGGYAVQFAFSDGHRTGLYSYDYLRRLGHYLRTGEVPE